MLSVVFALAAAMAYGLADFIGGLASRQGSSWAIALVSALGSLASATVLALAFPGQPEFPDLLWGGLAGIGGGLGGAFLFRGLASGRMGVVAPISAVGATVLPVFVAAATGERPPILVWLGVAAAIPSIWLVASDPASEQGWAGGLIDGLLAGAGAGLLFAAMAQVPVGAGWWPTAIAQAAALGAIVITATAMRAPFVPRRRVECWGIAAGLVSTLAVVCFLLATQSGLLTVAAVLSSLYPAFTILLAMTLLGERILWRQAMGLVCCCVAVALVVAA